MLKAIKNIIIFIISLMVVSIASYLYIYKGFIDVVEKNKIQYKENIINKVKNEKTYTINDLLTTQETKKNSNISKLITKFINNKWKLKLNLHVTLKPEAIIQVNNLMNNHLFIENTVTDLYVNIVPLINNQDYINIYWKINDKEIIIKWFVNIDDSTFVFTYCKIDWFLTLFNNEWYNWFLADNFNIKYWDIIWKKISLKTYIKNILDVNIPESKYNSYQNILSTIENFILLDNSNEFYFLFSNKLKNTTTQIKKYILRSKTLPVGQKQSILLDLSKLSNQLDNTEITLDKDRLNINNLDSTFLFDFNFTLNHVIPTSDKIVDNIPVDNSKIYNIDEIFNLLLNKNKLLVKYLNWEDLLFLIKTKKED